MLAAVQLHTPEDVWKKAAENPAEPLAALSGATGLTSERLKTALTDGGRAAAIPMRGNWLARHWLDLAVLGVIALVIALARRDPPKSRTALVAQALVPVGAFQVLRDVHVTDSTRVPSTGAGRRDGLPGRITLRPLMAGEAVTEADLGPRMAPDALVGRAVLALSTLPVQSPVVPQEGSRVGVVLSPRASGAGGVVLRDVLVLSATQTDSALRMVVALAEADLPAVAALLGNSDVHLVASPHAP